MASQVLSDQVFVCSRVKENWSASLCLSCRFHVCVYQNYVVVTKSWDNLGIGYVEDVVSEK